MRSGTSAQENNVAIFEVFLAIIQNNPITELLKKVSDINAFVEEDYVQKTLLYVAAERKRADIIDELLDAGASIDATSSDKETPLYVATINGHLEVVKKLSQRGANVVAVGPSGHTPLHAAAESNHVQIIHALLDAGASIDATSSDKETPLHVAARRGNLEAARALLARGANVDVTDEWGQTPLYIAASAIPQEKHTEIIDELLNKGAKIDVVSTGGKTPLEKAIKEYLDSFKNRRDRQKGYLDAIHKLLERGAQFPIHDMDEASATLFQLAKKDDSYPLFLLLIQNVFKNKSTDDASVCAMQVILSAIYNHCDEVLFKKIVNQLIEIEADFNILFPLYPKSKINKALLHKVVTKIDYLNYLDILLENKKIIVDIVSSNGATPLYYAAKNNNSKAVSQLIEHSANVNFKSSDSETPLNRVIKKAYLNINAIVVLVENGADINAVCHHHGKTPLHHALSCSFSQPAIQFKIVKFLLENGAKFDEAHIEPRLLSEYVNRKGHEELADIINQRALDDYIKQTEARGPKNYKRYVNFFGLKIGLGYDAATKAEEAKKMQARFNDSLISKGETPLFPSNTGSQSDNTPREGVLNNGELGTLRTRLIKRQI